MGRISTKYVYTRTLQISSEPDYLIRRNVAMKESEIFGGLETYGESPNSFQMRKVHSINGWFVDFDSELLYIKELPNPMRTEEQAKKAILEIAKTELLKKRSSAISADEYQKITTLIKVINNVLNK